MEKLQAELMVLRLQGLIFCVEKRPIIKEGEGSPSAFFFFFSSLVSFRAESKQAKRQQQVIAWRREKMVAMFHWYELSLTQSLQQQIIPRVVTKSQKYWLSSALSGLGLPIKHLYINGIQQHIQLMLKLKFLCQGSNYKQVILCCKAGSWSDKSSASQKSFNVFL